MVKVPIPIKGSIDEPASKINVLLNKTIKKYYSNKNEKIFFSFI